MSNQEHNNEALIGGSESNGGLGIEPNLKELIRTDYNNFTWGDKKECCKNEARNAWEQGLSLSDNPFIPETWSHKWWNDGYIECDA